MSLEERPLQPRPSKPLPQGERPREWDFGLIREFPPDFRCGYVALAGKPNVGKSTLLNILVGEKVAIVSSKPQTTRRQVVGILTLEKAQVIFLDAPGIHVPRLKLGEAMVRQAREALKEGDAILCLMDASGPPDAEDRLVMATVQELAPHTPRLLVLNKMDLLRQEALEERLALYRELGSFDEAIPVSALYGVNIERVLEWILAHLPLSPPLYPEDVLSPEQEREAAAEIIREAILEALYEEVPHSVAVEVEEWKERANGMLYIRATIYVERDSQKRILIGSQGSMLRRVGTQARRHLEAMTGRRVYLDLWIKVWKNWRKDERALRRLGFWK